MYLVIVGGGKIGSNLIDLAVEDKHDVVVIERDETKADEIAARHDCVVLHADATSEQALQDAGIDEADAVISTTNIDAVNVMVMLLAQEHEVPNLLSVVHDEEHLPVFEKIGVNIIGNPQRLIADHLYRSVRFPGVGDFLDLGEGLDLVEMELEEGAPAAGRTLVDTKSLGILPDQALVVAIRRSGVMLQPQGDTELQDGDRVTMMVEEDDLGGVTSAFEPES